MAAVKSAKSVDREGDVTSPIQEPNWLEAQSNLRVVDKEKEDTKNKKKNIRDNQVSVAVKNVKSADREGNVTSPTQEPNWFERQSNLEAKIKLLTKGKNDLQTELLDLKKENRRLHRIIDTADSTYIF